MEHKKHTKPRADKSSRPIPKVLCLFGNFTVPIYAFLLLLILSSVIAAVMHFRAAANLAEILSEISVMDNFGVTLDVSIKRDNNAPVNIEASGKIKRTTNQAEFTATIDDGSEKYSIANVLDNDTLYIDNELILRLLGDSADFTLIGSDESLAKRNGNVKTIFPAGYTSVFLPTYDLPTLDYRPDWVDSLDLVCRTLKNDIRQHVALPKPAAGNLSGGYYAVTLDTDEVCGLIDQIAHAGTLNTAQYATELQGSQLRFIRRMRASSSTLGGTLADMVQTLHDSLPDTIYEGDIELSKQIIGFATLLKEQAAQNQLTLSYSIYKTGAVYTQTLLLRYEGGSAEFVFTQQPADSTSITIPPRSTDLEVRLDSLFPGDTLNIPHPTSGSEDTQATPDIYQQDPSLGASSNEKGTE